MQVDTHRVVVVIGGALGVIRRQGRPGKPRAIALILQAVAGIDMWKLEACSQEACRLLTGKPSSLRPLCRLSFFQTFAEALDAARHIACAEVKNPRVADDENVAEHGGGCVASKTAMRKINKERPVLEITMPLKPPRQGQANGLTHTLRVKNAAKEFTFEYTPASIDWAIAYVADDARVQISEQP